jgi:hypothetical protein
MRLRIVRRLSSWFHALLLWGGGRHVYSVACRPRDLLLERLCAGALLSYSLASTSLEAAGELGGRVCNHRVTWTSLGGKRLAGCGQDAGRGMGWFCSTAGPILGQRGRDRVERAGALVCARERATCVNWSGLLRLLLSRCMRNWGASAAHDGTDWGEGGLLDSFTGDYGRPRRRARERQRRRTVGGCCHCSLRPCATSTRATAVLCAGWDCMRTSELAGGQTGEDGFGGRMGVGRAAAVAAAGAG